MRFRGCAGSNNASDFAPHELLTRSRRFHLLAQSHPVTLVDQPRNVRFGGVVGHAAHGNIDSLVLVTRSQGNAQLARGGYRIVIEQFVEVSQPEKKQRAGYLLFDGVVLPHERRGGFRH